MARLGPIPCTITVYRLDDPDPDVSYLDQPGFEERKQQYEDGVFTFIGIRAIGVCGEITVFSGGLWGIESDSDEEYLTRIGDDEAEDVRRILRDHGIQFVE